MPAATCPTSSAKHQTGRVPVLDALRGFTLLSMIVYHLCYNLDAIFGYPMAWYHNAGAQVWQLCICGVFLLLAGACTHFTRHPVRRALRIGAAALLVTAVTHFAMPEERIVFGILHCMAVCMLIYAAVQPLLRKVPAPVGAAVCLLLFAVTYRVPQGYLLFKPFAVMLPQAWYRSYWLSVIGLLSPDFASADYFPIIPYIFLFAAGHYLGYALGRLPQRVRDWAPKPLALLGRHSMTVYLLHQPILYGVMLLFLG